MSKSTVTPPNYDLLCRQSLNKSRDMLIPWYLMTSYAYYKLDESLISDGLYDEICRRIEDEWESICHLHKHLVDRAGLAAGSGYAIREYPLMAQGSTNELLKGSPSARAALSDMPW